MSTMNDERSLVRELARQVAEIAAERRMQEITQRWRDVNALRRPDRAPVWCRPVGCWKELLPKETLVCRTPWLREIEYGFRQVLVKREIDDDTPVDPWFAVRAVFRVSPENVWGVDIGRHESTEEGGAWGFDPPLKTPEDFERLRQPTYTYDEAETREALDRANDLLGDILPVRLECGPHLSGTLCHYAAALRGLSEIMWDMAIDPDLVHRLMAHVRDAALADADAVEATGLVTPDNHGPMTCSDPIGPEPPDGRYTLKNCWCHANSQEFDQVSPAMWDEFLLEYQKPLFQRYGLVAYGCCENLTKKAEGVLSIPNLRVFVCSAWTDLDRVLELVGHDYCIMWRQKASAVVFPDDTETIYNDLEEGLRKLQGRPYQIVLRELQTLAGHPDRLHVWTRAAKELAAKYC
jgi:hypothetical protein